MRQCCSIASGTPLRTDRARRRAVTIFLIVLENHNWSSIAGNSAAPYLNHTLLPQASYATQDYNPPGIHPSLPNYLWLETGTTCGVFDDNPPASHHFPTHFHLTALLTRAAIPWTVYAEGIDGRSCPLTAHFPYAPKHVAVLYFDDITGSNNSRAASCLAHVRPYAELAGALCRDTVARYTVIVPDLCDSGHDACAPLNDPVRQTDAWLAHVVPPILRSAAYRRGGVLFITWDEGEGGSDGPIGLLALSQRAKGHGYASAIHYTHKRAVAHRRGNPGGTAVSGRRGSRAGLARALCHLPLLPLTAVHVCRTSPTELECRGRSAASQPPSNRERRHCARAALACDVAVIFLSS